MSRAHGFVSIRNLSTSQLCMFKCQAMSRATDEHLAQLGLSKTRAPRRTRLKPRNLFAMPEGTEKENEADMDVDSLDVGIEDMAVSRTHEELKNWRRPIMEGESGNDYVIEKALAEAIPKPNDSDLLDEEDDDTYINDGHVAPADSLDEGSDDDFFCLNHNSLLSHCLIVFSLNNGRVTTYIFNV
jgi:hypothetical protein